MARKNKKDTQIALDTLAHLTAEANNTEAPHFGLPEEVAEKALLIYMHVETDESESWLILKNSTGSVGGSVDKETLEQIKAELFAAHAPSSGEEQAHEQPRSIIIGDMSDPLTKEILEVAATLKDDDVSRRYFVAAVRFGLREFMLEMRDAWTEIRRVAGKNSQGGEKAATASVGIGFDLDITNPNVLAVDFSFKVTPWSHKHSASAKEDLSQQTLDFISGTITVRHDESGSDGGAQGGESGDGDGEQAAGDESADTASAAPTYAARLVELEAMDREAIVKLAGDKGIELKPRSSKTAIAELIAASEGLEPEVAAA